MFFRKCLQAKKPRPPINNPPAIAPAAIPAPAPAEIPEPESELEFESELAEEPDDVGRDVDELVDSLLSESDTLTLKLRDMTRGVSSLLFSPGLYISNQNIQSSPPYASFAKVLSSSKAVVQELVLSVTLAEKFQVREVKEAGHETAPTFEPVRPRCIIGKILNNPHRSLVIVGYPSDFDVV